jgi:hypothetical protein
MRTTTHIHADSAHLDALIAKLKNSGEGKLLIEHLQTAHAYLHGAMPMECAHNLELAQHDADKLSDQPLQAEVKDTIAGLLQTVDPAPQERQPSIARPAAGRPRHVTAKGLTEFFHGADTSFGIFYPKKHVVAVFSSFDQAQAAHRVLSCAGFRMWEIILVRGEEVELFLEEIRVHRALWDELIMQISSLLDTEVNLVNRYAHWARNGYGFVVARSPNSEAAEHIAEILEPMHPIAMHWFMSGSIRHLTEGN